ncbi:MAG TPA: hypothetical protein VF455_05355 [Chryseobacterium sp.]
MSKTFAVKPRSFFSENIQSSTTDLRENDGRHIMKNIFTKQ